MLCFATNNLHKIQEVRAHLGPDFQLVGLEEIGCFDELPEEQPTLEGNSFQKAEYVYKNFGVSCFADDTGLEVEALSGAPGVYSARYAGEQRSAEDNMSLLLKNLSAYPNKSARFRTVITLITPGLTRQFEGIVNGQIIHEHRGSGGFGYDPVFLTDGYEKTLAEMSMEEKNTISHRARAVNKLVEFLKTTHSSLKDVKHE
jgi:XTP/dITP diphosphohydrolase